MYEDFSDWVQNLLSEGYDLSDYTWDEMYDIYEETLDEKREREARIAARRARVKEMEREGKVMTSSKRTSRMAAQRRQEKAEAEREAKLAKAAADILASMGHSGRVSDRPMGSTPPAPREAAPEANRRLPRHLRKDTLGKAADQALKDEYEVYELVLEHLVEEGFADDYSSANTMVEYMSEEWLVDILEANKWLQRAIKKPGALSRQLGVPESKNIPSKMLKKAAKSGGKLGRRARLAMTLRKFR